MGNTSAAGTRHTLGGVLRLLQAALPRVAPTVFTYPPPPPHVLWDTYVALNPVITVVLLTVVLCTAQTLLLVSLRRHAPRLPALIPPLYAVLYALHGPVSSDRATNAAPDLRLSVMALLAALWAVRRARRSRTSPTHRFLLLRMLLYAANVAPLHAAWVERGNPASPIDPVAAVGCILALVAQSVADKTLSARGPATFASGGIGPFAWCRHPGEAADAAFWASYYLFALASAGAYAWYGAGALGYAIATAALTVPHLDRLRSAKFKSYPKYMQSVGALIPRPPKKSITTNAHPKSQ